MQRVIVLGASNVTLAFPLIAEGLRDSFTEPVQLFAAHGHGRSYGLRSRVLVRRLPAIRQCGLWDALATQPECNGSPLALLTDVGNDLLFGVNPDMLLSWVDECVVRLRDVDASVTLVSLPLERVLRMSAARYHATRMAFFPGPGRDWATMQQMAKEVDAGLREMAGRHGCQFITPRGEWYGFDPIHIRRSQRAAVWSEYLSAWPEVEDVHVKWRSTRHGLPYWRLAPAERDLWGRTRFAEQPAWTDGNGSTIWLY
ncbi:MAG: hypothetical protein KDA86_25385 [Planctomycetaceae bacterium]|nr:hypothetical protein [Planctomycetaceae bacterium]